MNKERKQKIKNIKQNLDILYDDLRWLKEEEEEYYGNIPENLQGTLRADESEEYIDQLEDAIANIEEALDTLGNIS